MVETGGVPHERTKYFGLTMGTTLTRKGGWRESKQRDADSRGTAVEEEVIFLENVVGREVFRGIASARMLKKKLDGCG